MVRRPAPRPASPDLPLAGILMTSLMLLSLTANRSQCSCRRNRARLPDRRPVSRLVITPHAVAYGGGMLARATAGGDMPCDPAAGGDMIARCGWPKIPSMGL